MCSNNAFEEFGDTIKNNMQKISKIRLREIFIDHDLTDEQRKAQRLREIANKERMEGKEV
jgi:hypothetical protein